MENYKNMEKETIGYKTKKKLKEKIEDIRLNFSKKTGAINKFVAFGNKCNREVNGYNQALSDILNLLEEFKERKKRALKDIND